jgi:hypothetical protein
MNDDDLALRQLLRSLPLPPASDAVRGRARDRALSAYRNAPRRERRAGWFPWWLLLAASAAVLILVPLGIHGGRTPDKPTVFAELETMFPGQLVAAVKENGSLDLQLAEVPGRLPKDQRILITLRKEARQVQVLTYSGYTARVNLGGHSLDVTPLVRGDGSVLIVAGNQLLEDAGAPMIDGFQVQARTLSGGRS